MNPCFISTTTPGQKSLFARLNITTALSGLLLLVMLACSAYAQANEYRLGYEDVIIVTVVGHGELSGEFYIPSDGMIDVPRVGQICVTGKTLSEVSRIITGGVRKFLLNPDVSLKLKTPRTQLIYVVGAVTRPGSYDLKPGWTVSEALGAAGGVVTGVENSDCTIVLFRGSAGAKISMPLADLTQGNAKNLPLEPGDLITAEVIQSLPVYIMGKVSHPGLYNMRSDNAGLLAAITVAGGTLEDAALTKVTVTHLNGEAETVSIVPVTVDGKQKDGIKLRAGDLVVVPESLSKFAVLGWVNSPGFFPLQENKVVTLSEAIGMAKGTDNKRGGITKVAVIHASGDRQDRGIYDLGRFLKDGDPSQNPVIKSGDVVYVPETNKVDWDRLLSAISTSCSLIWTVGKF